MSDDEQLRAKKDTLWGIHTQQSLIACLEKKLSDHWDAIDKIRETWNAGKLGVIGERLVHRRGERPATHLPPRLTSNQFVDAVRELEEARERMERLEESFGRMIGAWR